MHAAQVTSWSSPPTYTEIPIPTADASTTLIKVLAAGQHQTVKSRAAGKHYSATTLPYIPGVDGVGTTPSGQKVYFICMQTGGSFAEYLTVPNKMMRPLPEGLDPVKAAALMNPAISSWMALRVRCERLKEGFSVLVMGATSASGRMAVELARKVGAGKVLGVARNEEALKEMKGLDGYVVLQTDVSKTDFSSVAHVDVVLDYVFGAPTAKLLADLKPEGKVQYVHIGSLAGLEMSLPGQVLRSKDLVIRGSGMGAWSIQEMGHEVEPLLEAIKEIEGQEIEVKKLEDVESAWDEVGGKRKVFVP